MDELLRYTDIENPDYVPEGKLFRILFDSRLGMMRVVARESRLMDCMRDAFSDDNPAAFFMSMHGYSMDSKVYLINNFGYFKPGMLFEVLDYIRLHYGNLKCVHLSQHCRDYITDWVVPLKKYLGNATDESFEVLNVADETGANAQRPEEARFTPRDYQVEAVRKVILEGYGRGLVELPTSAGKSFVISNLIYTMDRRVIRGLRYLIFVPNRQLVDQFHKDMLEYGFKRSEVTRFTSGLKGDDKFNPEAMVIIANRQYVGKNRDRLPKIDFLINDEVHQSKPKSATLQFVDELPCRFKVGFSATIPRTKYGKLSLVGSFGRLLYVKDITELQKSGYISKLEINLLKVIDGDVQGNRNLLFHEHSLRRFTTDPRKYNGIKFNDAYDAELKYVNDNYRKLYSPILGELNSMEGNTLVLFDRLEFGQNMFELAKASSWGKDVSYIDGATPIKDREDARSKMEATNNNILFGQCSILSTGINIKNLTNLVLMVSTKSFSRILQSIGRTLRLHRDKDTARLFDISFNFKYSQKHLRERLGIYREMYKKSPDSTKTIKV